MELLQTEIYFCLCVPESEFFDIICIYFTLKRLNYYVFTGVLISP